VIDLLSEKKGISLNKKRYLAWWGRGFIKEKPVILAKPYTFMNLSGKAVKRLLSGLDQGPEDLIIVHDDVDLALGKIRVKIRGGDAGHKGVRSILEELGTDKFTRVRLGIGRPAKGEEMVDYVLSTFTPAEEDIVIKELEEAVAIIEDIIAPGRNLKPPSG
jgi:PTH1 family peptidyl-tRNA hydrolase